MALRRNLRKRKKLINLRLKVVLAALSIVVAIGTSGYIIIEKAPFLDALYMTIITVATVGYREVFPLSSAGKIFTIFLIPIGVGTVFYGIGTFVSIVVQDFLQQNIVGRRRMKKTIEKYSNHFIVAGFGRVGSNVAHEFVVAKQPFVVIENDPQLIPDIQEHGYVFIEGDATDDEVLLKAGVEKAKGLVAAIHSDADNVFIVLSARRMNPKIFIVARANSLQTVDKLKTAGADRVVSPAVIGGRRMAAWLLRPVVSDYLDLVSHGAKLEYRLEEIQISPDSELGNKTIGGSDIRGKTGATVLAIKSEDKINTNPSIKTELKTGDLLIVIGTDEQLKELEQMA